GECCALLGMRHREKTSFGARLTGEIVRLDEPQRALYFTDHTLAEPSPSLPAARARLRVAMFEGLVKGFAAHVADVRAQRHDLEQAEAIEAAQLRSRGAQSTLSSPTRRLDELRARLAATAEALQPEGLLEALAECLAHPEPFLRLEPIEISVDRNGIITSPGAAGEGDTLHFAELTSRDQRRWVVILARIRQEEARRAIERIEAARRYIVI
ncbi:MAG: hypothetical protein N2690_11415, partial [Rhodocyclaceae bacterium]|nr:hypothetical protein [Rhodocyclaceae bacterium]